MPVVRVTYPRGALSPTEKQVLATSLTDIVLDAEVDAITDAGKMVTVIHFLEAAAEDVAQFIGGDLDPRRRADISAALLTKSSR